MSLISISSDRYVTYFDKDSEPAVEVASGAVVQLTTMDWCFNRVTGDPTTYLRATQTPRCPATGPVAVKDLHAGDTLAVEILDIEVYGPGHTVIRPGSGVMGDIVRSVRVAEIPIESGCAVFPGGTRVPIQPMLGVMGVAPDGERIPTLYAGPHGGNLDTREIRAGATVYLPVATGGGLLSVGDAHAVMGDGELSGSGVEVAADVTLRPVAIPGRKIAEPRIENKKYMITLATDADFTAAVRRAGRAMVEWIQEKARVEFDEAYLLLGTCGQTRVSQVVNATGPTVKILFPREFLQNRNLF